GEKGAIVGCQRLAALEVSIAPSSQTVGVDDRIESSLLGGGIAGNPALDEWIELQRETSLPRQRAEPRQAENGVGIVKGEVQLDANRPAPRPPPAESRQGHHRAWCQRALHVVSKPVSQVILLVFYRGADLERAIGVTS